jgi:type I restriction enzyme, S subunit
MVSIKKKIEKAKAFMGDFPKEWVVHSLDEVLELIKNGTSEPQNNEKKGVPVTRIETIADGKVNYSKVGFVKTDKDLSEYKLNEGDILFSNINSVKHIAKIARYDGKKTLYHGMNLLMLRPGNNVDSSYLYYLLSSYPVKKYFESNAKQAVNQASVNQSDVKSFVTAYPPLIEQQKIVNILSSADNAIEITEAIIEKTQKIKKGLMQELFTKGIGHWKFKQTDIGEIPDEWEVRSFIELLKEQIILGIQDGNHGETHPKASDYVEKGIPFIMANNLVNGSLELKNCKYISKEQADKLRIGFAKSGDVLLSHKGTIGRTAIVPKIQDYVMLTPQVTYYRIGKKEVLSNRFLKLYFESSRFQSILEALSSQSTRSYIGITNQKKLLMVLPSINEQQKIVNIIESIDNKLFNENQRLLKLQECKKGLMQVLLTGKVRVKLSEEEVTTS